MTKQSQSKHRFIKALHKQPVDRTPVWIMRQAGRYMPEYRALRAKAGNFLELCRNPNFAKEATMLPIKRFALDAAILFSDILILPDVMGLELSFVADEGPVFAKTIDSLDDVKRLPEIDAKKDLSYVNDAIAQIVTALNGEVPLIGFAGSPWTVASYMVEGKTSKQFYKFRKMMYAEPATMHALLEYLSLQITRALQAQIDSGVEVVMLFDSWGGILDTQNFAEFSINYMNKIVTAIKQSHPNIPIILFSKNGGKSLDLIAAGGADAIGLDWTADIRQARIDVGSKVALQGNLDPCVLYASDDKIVSEVRRILTEFAGFKGHIFNLGHGIPKDVHPEKVDVLLKAIHELSPQFINTEQMVE